MQETIEQFMARGGKIQKIATVDMVAAVAARQSADVDRIRTLFASMDREDREMEIALEKERAKRAYNTSEDAAEAPAPRATVPAATFKALRETVRANKRLASTLADHFRTRSGVVTLRTCECGESFPFTPGETECPSCKAAPAAPSLFDEESVAA